MTLDLLAIAAHPDDVEQTGTAAQLIKMATGAAGRGAQSAAGDGHTARRSSA